jgi:hypothetical protein
MSNTVQLDLLIWKKRPPTVHFGDCFDGVTFKPERDGKRLQSQLSAVFELMRDGKWRTLSQISASIGAPAQSVSARLRDLRKTKFLGAVVERRFVSNGLFEYRIVEKEC